MESGSWPVALWEDSQMSVNLPTEESSNFPTRGLCVTAGGVHHKLPGGVDAWADYESDVTQSAECVTGDT